MNTRVDLNSSWLVFAGTAIHLREVETVETGLDCIRITFRSGRVQSIKTNDVKASWEAIQQALIGVMHDQ